LVYQENQVKMRYIFEMEMWERDITGVDILREIHVDLNNCKTVFL
jgi:hypothetical protein